MRILSLAISVMGGVMVLNSCTCEGTDETALKQQKTVASADSVFWLYVTKSESGYVDGNKIIFKNPDRNLLYFSDRPNRLAGIVPLDHIENIWATGKESFESDPPNAVLALFNDEIDHNIGAHDEIEETVITLNHAGVTDSTLIFEYTLIMGELPKKFGENTLFIDRRAQPADPCSTCPSSFGCDDEPFVPASLPETDNDTVYSMSDREKARRARDAAKWNEEM
jgi:hypothetical protein